MPSDDAYDFVVVGGGSAGCALVHRLTTARAGRILLLEAGGAGTEDAITDPTRWPALLGSPVDWGYQTIPQRHAAGRRQALSQGKVLGGGSSLNSMVYMRGAPWDYDGWAMRGNPSWDYQSVLAVFRAIEDFPGGDPRYRGRGGPLKLSVVGDLNPVTEAFLAACAERGFAPAEDFNGATAEGYAPHQLNLRAGVRQAAHTAFLDPVSGRPDVTVRTGVTVRRIGVNATGRALDLEVVSDGEVSRIDVTGQLVLCAGAIASPKLLMLSGIGPVPELERAGVPVVLDLPGVGQNLHDHVAVPVTWSASRPVPPPRNQLSEASLFCRSDPRLPRYDLQFVCPHLPVLPPGFAGGPDGYSIVGGVVNPSSRGQVRLRSADPCDPPLIDPAYLRDPVDRERLCAAVEIARDIGTAPAFAAWRGTELAPAGSVADRGGLRRYVERSATTYYHPVGTCQMGNEHDSVVDSRLRVHGTENIWVADNSIMPSIVSANPNAAAMMIGWKAAEFLADCPAPGPELTGVSASGPLAPAS